MTAQQNATALIAALNTALAPRVAYDLDKVPATRPADYAEVTVSRRFGGERRSCGGLGLTGYRATVRGVSQTSVANVRNLLEKSRAALEFQRITIGVEASTPIQFETEDPIVADDGWFSGLLAFTWTIRD